MFLLLWVILFSFLILYFGFFPLFFEIIPAWCCLLVFPKDQLFQLIFLWDAPKFHFFLQLTYSSCLLSSIFAWYMDILISSFLLSGWCHALFSRHAYSFLLNEKGFVNNVEDPCRICALLCQGERMDQNEELDLRGGAAISVRGACFWLSLLCPRRQGSPSSWSLVYL